MGKHHKQILKEEWLFCGQCICQIKSRGNLNLSFKLFHELNDANSKTINLTKDYLYMSNCYTSNNSCINIKARYENLMNSRLSFAFKFGFIYVAIRERFVLSPFWDYPTVDLLKYICIDAV